MNALIKDCIKLVTITVIAGAALGAVYGITKEPIAAQEAKTQMEAYAAVFPEAAEFHGSRRLLRRRRPRRRSRPERIPSPDTTMMRSLPW